MPFKLFDKRRNTQESNPIQIISALSLTEEVVKRLFESVPTDKTMRIYLTDGTRIEIDHTKYAPIEGQRDGSW